jgi:hypothetical protein
MKENLINTIINQSYSYFLTIFKDINNKRIKFNDITKIIDNINSEQLEEINNKMKFNFSKFILLLKQSFTEIKDILDIIKELYEEEDNLVHIFLDTISRDEISIYHFIRRLKEHNLFDLIRIPEGSPVTEKEVNLFMNSSFNENVDILLEVLANIKTETEKEKIYEKIAMTLIDNNVDFDEISFVDVLINFMMFIIKVNRHMIIQFISCLHKERIGITEISDKDIPLPKEEDLNILRGRFCVSVSLVEIAENLNTCIFNINQINKVLCDRLNLINVRKEIVFYRRYMQAINILTIAFPENEELKDIVKEGKKVIYL